MPEATVEGKTRTDVRFWCCSNCGHREWATTAEFKEWVANPPPMLGGMWRFRAKVDAVWCVCQQATAKEYRPRTMKMYKTTILLGEGESFPNIGIKTTLQDSLSGADPIPENAIDTVPKEEIQLVVAVAPVVPSPLKAQADPVETNDADADAIFKDQTGASQK